MWWRILVALVLTLPPVAYVAGALANDEQHREPHPTVVLDTEDTDADRHGGDRDRPDRGEGNDRQQDKRDREGDGPGGVTVVRPGPMAVGDDGGDEDDDGDDGDETDDSDDD